MQEELVKIAIVSGYFNPVHVGHIELLEKAKEISDFLVVIVNNDRQRKLKGSLEFQDQSERCYIMSSLNPVDSVILSVDDDRTVRKSLKMIWEKYNTNNPTLSTCSDVKKRYKLIFVNGGDQFSESVAERDVCEELGIDMVDRMGDKIQSSSWLLGKNS